jgi:hypothetical protein
MNRPRSSAKPFAAKKIAIHPNGARIKHRFPLSCACPGKEKYEVKL